MIVHREGARLVVVTQSDHARFSGELMALWRANGLADHPRRREVLFAIREHDNGWREVDAAPYVDRDTGRPHDFLTLPRPLRTEIWRRGSERFAGDHPYASLLITHHALYLHRDRRDDPELAGFLAALDERHQALREETGADAETVEADYRFLDLGDLASLVACNRWREPVSRRGVTLRLAGDDLLLAPFPLAGATTFRVPARRIPARRYGGDADLAGELAAARWEGLRVRVAPDRTGAG